MSDPLGLTVGELIDELKKYPRFYDVHLDIFSEEEKDEREVRYVSGVALQQGFSAVAIDSGDLVGG